MEGEGTGGGLIRGESYGAIRFSFRCGVGSGILKGRRMLLGER